jgi:uncharacterized protein (TIGR02147 family)
MKSPPDIFTYTDYRLFLSDWLAYKKHKNPRYSQRVLLRKAGITGTGTLVNVIGGRRNLSLQSAGSLADGMGLAPPETEYFEALVRATASDDAAVREAALAQTEATRRFRAAKLEDRASLDFLTHWYIPAIYELAACDGFDPSPAWIAGQLRPRIDEAHAADGIAVLCAIGLLVRTPTGLQRAQASLATPHEVASAAVRAYHAGMLQRAADALSYDAAERHLCAVTVAVDQSQLGALKGELDRFQERLLGLCDGAAGSRNLVIQLNLQLVPLSFKVESPA